MTDSDSPLYQKSKGAYHALSHASLGLEMAVSIFVGFGAGYWLDKRFGTDPWLMLVFLFFGIAAAFRAMFRAARQMRREVSDTTQQMRQSVAQNQKETIGHRPASLGKEEAN